MSAKSSARLLIPVFVRLFLSAFLTASAQTAIPPEERQALMAFYNSTEGPGWFRQTNWLGPEGTEGTWLGIVVENGHVVKISLPGNGLKGVVPSEIAGLQQLEVLDLTGDQPYLDVPYGIRNRITSLAPATGSLEKLRTLKVSGVGLQSIPDEICQLTGLETLDLSSNGLATLPSQIGALSNLRFLDVSSTLLTSLPAGIGKLAALEALDLGGNNLEHLPPELGQLTSLTELRLGTNPLIDIPPELGGLPNLVSVSFWGMSRLPAGIGALKNVQKLSAVYLDSEELSAEVGDMANLRELRLTLGSLRSLPATLARLTKLELLDLSHNSLREIPLIIGQITNLQSLLLGGNPLIGPIPASFGNLTRLKELALTEGLDTDSVLSGTLPPELGNMASLETLILEGNFSGPVPAEFGDLASLKVLNLYGQFTDVPGEIGRLRNLVDLKIRGSREPLYYRKAPFKKIPAEIGGLTNLRSLHLVGSATEVPPELGNLTALTDLWLTVDSQTPIPKELGNLKALLNLRLNGGFTGTIPAWICDLSDLETLDLSDNHLEGKIPVELAELSSVWVLKLSHNRLEGNIPYQILDKSRYSVFDASSNRLSGPLPRQLGEISSGTWVNWRWNALYPVELSVFEFISKHHMGDFGGTQSYGPVAVTATGTGNGVHLSWSPITYQSDSGGYEILYRERADEPWSVCGMTNSKEATSFTVTGLPTGRQYYFAVRTVTYPHANNQNTVRGDPGNIVIAGTTASAEAWFPLYPNGPNQFTGLAVTNLAGGDMHGQLHALSTGGGQAVFPRNPAPLSLSAGRQLAQVQAEIFGTGGSAAEPWAMRLEADQTPVTLCLQGGPGLLDGATGVAGQHKRLLFSRVYEGADVLAGQTAVTRINLLNPDASGVWVHLRLISPKAQIIGPPIVIVEVARWIAPGGLLSETLAELFSLAQPVAKAYVEVLSEGEGVNGLAVVTVGQGKSFFVVPGSPPSGFSEMSAAQVASGSQVATSVRLINTDPIKRVVTLRLYPDGENLRQETRLEIPAFSLVERDLSAVFQLPGKLSAASLQASANGTGVLGDILVYGPEGEYASVAQLSSRPAREAVCGYLANGLGVFTGLALFNPGNDEAEVTVEILSGEGRLLGKAPVRLPGKGRLARQTAELVSSCAGIVGGYVRVTATQPIIVQEMFAADTLDYMSTVPPVTLK